MVVGREVSLFLTCAFHGFDDPSGEHNGLLWERLPRLPHIKLHFLPNPNFLHFANRRTTTNHKFPLIYLLRIKRSEMKHFLKFPFYSMLSHLFTFCPVSESPCLDKEAGKKVNHLRGKKARSVHPRWRRSTDRYPRYFSFFSLSLPPSTADQAHSIIDAFTSGSLVIAQQPGRFFPPRGGKIRYRLSRLYDVMEMAEERSLLGGWFPNFGHGRSIGQRDDFRPAKVTSGQPLVAA